MRNDDALILTIKKKGQQIGARNLTKKESSPKKSESILKPVSMMKSGDMIK